MAFSRTPCISQYQKDKPFWVLLKGVAWHQLDHMQVICISLQTDNHLSTSSLSFYRPPDAQAAVSKQCEGNN